MKIFKSKELTQEQNDKLFLEAYNKNNKKNYVLEDWRYEVVKKSVYIREEVYYDTKRGRVYGSIVKKAEKLDDESYRKILVNISNYTEENNGR